MPTRRGEEVRREEASTSRRGYACPAQSPHAFPGFPWVGSRVGLRRAKLCESGRRALLCAIPSPFSASQTLLLCSLDRSIAVPSEKAAEESRAGISSRLH